MSLQTAVQRLGPDTFASLRDEWRELVGDAATATPFQTFEWMSTWSKHFGRPRIYRPEGPQVVTVREGRGLIGLYPMMKTGGPWRTLRPMGMGVSDYLHPLARTGYERLVNSEIESHLTDRKDVDLVDLHQIREDRACFSAHHNGSREEQARCLVLELPDSFNAYLSTLGKSLRYDVRKLEKTLFSQGRARIEHVDSLGTQRGLDVLFELHRARWRKRHLPGAFLAGSIRFHREWADLAQKEGWLRLSVLHLDGNPIGAIYGMSLSNTSYYYQAGFDPNQGAVSPGTLLVGDAIRTAILEGKTQFDFLRGDEPYKRRWMPQQEFINYRTISPTHGALGRIGSKWNSMGFRVESLIRTRFEGRGLL